MVPNTQFTGYWVSFILRQVARCISESFLSLVTGLQAALRQLGKCPAFLGYQ